MGRKRQRQQLIFQPQIQEEQDQKQVEPQKDKVTILMREGVCVKENKVKAIHKKQYNIWYCRARRRYNKASYFSEQA